MPIKPENKARYPNDWKEISKRIRFVRANNHCEVCGIQNGLVIKRNKDGTWRKLYRFEWDMIHSSIRYGAHNKTSALKYHGFTKIVLTVAHLDHQPENCDDDNLKAMCQKCHNYYDREHRKESKIITDKNQLTLTLSTDEKN